MECFSQTYNIDKAIGKLFAFFLLRPLQTRDGLPYILPEKKFSNVPTIELFQRNSGKHLFRPISQCSQSKFWRCLFLHVQQILFWQFYDGTIMDTVGMTRKPE